MNGLVGGCLLALPPLNPVLEGYRRAPPSIAIASWPVAPKARSDIVNIWMGSFGTAQKPRANVASRASLRRVTIAWMGEPAQSEVKRPCRFDNNGPRPLSMYNLGPATPRVTCAFGRGLCWRSRTSRRIALLTHSWSHRPTSLLPRFPILSSLNSSTEQIANSLNRFSSVIIVSTLFFQALASLLQVFTYPYDIGFPCPN